MRAFHNDEVVKQKYLKRVDLHIKADNLIRGTGWKSGRGCAVGCTLENYDHKLYESELGIPEWLARLEDTLFENMSLKKSKTWPKVFLETINVGAYLEKVKVPFIVFLMRKNIETLDSLKVDEKYANVIDSISQSKHAVYQMIEAQESGDEAKIQAAESVAWSAESAARSVARSVARSAESVAWSAAWSAESVAWSAESAARSVAWSAESAARSVARSAESAAWSAAWSAARSVARSAARSAARSVARSVAFDEYADKLLELLKSEP